MSIDTLRAVVSDAAAMGYQVVALSGGEPLMYPGLAALLEHARSCGMRTTITTNGTLLEEGRLRRLAGLLDLVAVSLDGPPDLHNDIRGSPRAFDRLYAGVNILRHLGVPFGFIHTLTTRSWDHLPWVAGFAAKSGAALLQIHPLELAGRARMLMSSDSPPDDILARAYLIALVLASRYAGSMSIQLDVVSREHYLTRPHNFYADSSRPCDAATPADLLRTIVVEADGTVVPISYGFSRQYRVCNVRERNLQAAWSSYLEDGYPRLRRLCRDVFAQIAASTELCFLNWYEVIVAKSRQPILVDAGV